MVMLPFQIVLLAMHTVEMQNQIDPYADGHTVSIIFTWLLAMVAGMFLFAVLYFQRLYFKKHPELIDNP